MIAALVMLAAGYVFYGGWLAKQWGVDPTRKTPAHTMRDGMDYVPAKPAVLLGHHFASITGIGPINGPIQAAVFGWVPVFLWSVLGGIFLGGAHDFGALLASARHDGKSVGEVIKDSMGKRAGRLLLVFELIFVILVMASCVNAITGTLVSPNFGLRANPSVNETVAMISVLFTALAFAYGIVSNRFGAGVLPGAVAGILCVCVISALGLRFGIAMPRTPWIIVLCAYVTLASLLPVWTLLQPRDYLSALLFWGLMILSVIGILISCFTGTATFEIPAFRGWSFQTGALFPALFITINCGACGGYHAVIAPGTTSKQLDSEADAKLVGYGGMLLETALGIVSLIAVGAVFTRYLNGEFASQPVAFAAGLASMFGAETSRVYHVVYVMMTLAVSAFMLTNLDTTARVSRYLMAELFLKEGERSWREASGVRKVLAHPLCATLIMVGISGTLGALKLSQIWILFGAAAQLLAALTLMGVAAWLGGIGRNNKMLHFPAAFMLIVALCSLYSTVKTKLGVIGNGGALWGDYFQLVFAVCMMILGVIFAVESVRTMTKQGKVGKA